MVREGPRRDGCKWQRGYCLEVDSHREIFGVEF